MRRYKIENAALILSLEVSESMVKNRDVEIERLREALRQSIKSISFRRYPAASNILKQALANNDR